MSDELQTAIEDVIRGPSSRRMTLFIDEKSAAVEFRTDCTLSDYGQWVPGIGGADMCIYREQETDRVIGVRLPLLTRDLAVDWHKDD